RNRRIFLDTEEVTGSIPVSPTSKTAAQRPRAEDPPGASRVGVRQTCVTGRLRCRRSSSRRRVATVAAASACRAADSMRRTGASMTQTAATTAQLAAMAARVVIPPLLMMCRAATVAPEVIVVAIGVDDATVTDATPSAARAVIVTARRGDHIHMADTVA